ncbi:MAG: cyclopropane-fatty-acyl-phospholipid synthase family protein [Gemmatimonadetes bacterium]|nr:cyclopropane-fatty-acyl-phospholipid synthase family protein [Gemmatimonadota bacterium]
MTLKTVAAARMFSAAEAGRLGDSISRVGIRWLVRSRLRAIDRRAPLDESTLRAGPIAPAPREANEQHYEVPARFFDLVLGPWRKYSSGLWESGTTTLEDAEAAMMRLACERAGLEDGHDVLDLGCGWGALSLFIATSYPETKVLAVSHSDAQRAFIESEANRRGLDNVRVLTRDVSELELDSDGFDRVFSIEMFEHMNNYEELMRRITDWMRPGATLFVHVFCHRRAAYRFETTGAGDWMAREFFTGGLMPSASLLRSFQGALVPGDDRFLSGEHYAKTAEAWLARLDARRDAVRELFAETYGPHHADRHVQRWRLFFLAVAETFGFRDGDEWGLAHHTFHKPAARAAS